MHIQRRRDLWLAIRCIMRPRLSSRRRSDCGPARGGEGEGREEKEGRRRQTERWIDTFQGLGLTCLKHIKEIRYDGPLLCFGCLDASDTPSSLQISLILSRSYHNSIRSKCGLNGFNVYVGQTLFNNSLKCILPRWKLSPSFFSDL